MQHAIFPMKTISISQRYHDKHKAWDLNGEDTGIDYWYAPCRVKVLAMFGYKETGFYNTVLFGSCDLEGNPSEVMCEDGIARVLTFGCTHMNSLHKFDLQVGKIYESGERCYCEGKTGLSTGNHIHMDVAEGWQYKRIKYDDGQWLLPNLTNIANVFYRLNGWNVDRNLNGYTFKEVDGREVVEDESDGNAPFEYYMMNETDNLVLTAITNDEGNPTPIRVKDAFNKFNTVYGEIKLITGGQYFINKSSQSNYGEVQGRILGENVDEAPDQIEWLDVAVQIDTNEIHKGQLTSGDWRKPWARFGFSPLAMLIAGGAYSNEVSTGAVSSYGNLGANRFVLITQDWCNKLGLGVMLTTAHPDVIRKHFMEDKNIQYLWLCDGGGSAVGYSPDIGMLDGTGENRRIPVFYAMIKKEKLEPEPSDPSNPPVEEPTEPTEDLTEEDEIKGIGQKLIDLILALVKYIWKLIKKEG